MSGLGGISSILSSTGLFSSTAEGGGYSKIPLSSDQQYAANYLESLLKNKKLPLQKTAGLTAQGQSAIDQISDIQANGISGLDDATKLASDYANNTTDIMSLPEVQGLFKQINEAGSLESNRLGRTLQLSGSASSSKGRDVLGRNVTDTQQKLAASISPFIESERDRRYNAISLLAGLSEQQSTLPINLGLTADSTLRDIQNQKYAADYNQQLFPYNTQAGIASNILGEQRYSYQEPIISPSIAMQIAMLGNAAATVGAAF
jgi:hypothetical protein